MTVKELEEQLNLVAPPKFKFQALEKNKKVVVYVGVEDNNKDQLFELNPPDDISNIWYVNIASDACLLDSGSLPIYIKCLEVILKFLKEK